MRQPWAVDKQPAFGLAGEGSIVGTPEGKIRRSDPWGQGRNSYRCRIAGRSRAHKWNRSLKIPSFEFVPLDLSEMERKVNTHCQGADDQGDETRIELDRHRVT